MISNVVAIKERVQAKLEDLHARRRQVIDDFGARLKDQKIEQVRKSLDANQHES